VPRPGFEPELPNLEFSLLPIELTKRCVNSIITPFDHYSNRFHI
jgi:hypothetical protein